MSGDGALRRGDPGGMSSRTSITIGKALRPRTPNSSRAPSGVSRLRAQGRGKLAHMDDADRQDGTLDVDERKSAVDPEERDDRATEDPQEGSESSDPEPTPGEDAGPMGNPAEDEEALRHQQEESSGGSA